MHQVKGPPVRHRFHTARLVPRGNWFLGASTEWPGVEPPDVEIGDMAQLSELYPAAAQALPSFSPKDAP